MARVYAIRNTTTDQVYIGSTRQKLNHRFNHHRSHYREYIHGKRTDCPISIEIMKCPTAYIELLEECDEENRFERERFWIENTPNCINQIKRPRRSDEEKKQYYCEWKKQNIEKQREYHRNYMRVRRSTQQS
jgi:predicted GIY-YIG superfamily endonuclease